MGVLQSSKLLRRVQGQSPRVLIADDDPSLLSLARTILEMGGFQVIEAQNGLEALDLIQKQFPDAILLDVMMPGLDGFETLFRLREISSVPVIMLSAKCEEQDKVFGLELGADDYITKPFSARELCGRVRAVLRRTAKRRPPQWANLRIDERLSVDFNRHEVVVNGQHTKLPPTEYLLLYHLVENAGWTVPHDQLLAKVWGYEYRDESHYLRLYVYYLRKKIEIVPARPKYIQTEPGVGYRFAVFHQEITRIGGPDTAARGAARTC